MVFCPACGKKSNGFCENCKPIESISSKDIIIKVCSDCGKFFKNNKWQSLAFDKALINIAKDKIKDNVVIDLSNFDFKKTSQKKPGLKIDIEIPAIKENNLYIIPGKINYTYCDKCSKKQGKYFEGTLQLRNPNNDILDFVENYIKENNLSIAEKKEKKGSYDLDLSDQRKLQDLAHNLKKKFGGNLKISIRQFTQDRLTSKQIYRVNALYEAPDYKKGDVLKIENNLYFLTNVEKYISAIDLKTGKKTTIGFFNKKKDYQIIPQSRTKVTKIYPELEIMEPETYQSVFARNPFHLDLKSGENVKVIYDEGIYYLIK